MQDKKEKLKLGIGTSQQELGELKGGISMAHATELANNLVDEQVVEKPDLTKFLKPNGYTIAEIANLLQKAERKVVHASKPLLDTEYSKIAAEIYPALAEYFAATSPVTVPKEEHYEALNEALNRQVEAEHNLDTALEANEKMHQALLKKEEQVDSLIGMLDRAIIAAL